MQDIKILSDKMTKDQSSRNTARCSRKTVRVSGNINAAIDIFSPSLMVEYTSLETGEPVLDSRFGSNYHHILNVLNLVYSKFTLPTSLMFSVVVITHSLI